MNNDIKTRCTKFLDELKLPATRFCKTVNISTSSFYKWQRGELCLSDGTLERISDYLTKYGF